MLDGVGDLQLWVGWGRYHWRGWVEVVRWGVRLVMEADGKIGACWI